MGFAFAQPILQARAHSADFRFARQRDRVGSGGSMASDDQAVLQAIERLNARLERMEIRMSGMETRMSGIEGRLSSMEGRMSTIELVVADMDGRLKSWPDMHYLTAAAKAQMTHTRELKSDVADIKV